jgi:hypothetical protein
MFTFVVMVLELVKCVINLGNEKGGKMIRVRTDDVLVSSEPMAGKEFRKFRKHHLWLMDAPDSFYHTPAILCRDIQQFPECVEYIKQEQSEGRLRADLHGWEHDPEGENGPGYGFLSVSQIEERLEKCMEWFDQNLGTAPIRWLTPHGARGPRIDEAARKFNLVVEGVTDPVVDQKHAEILVRNAGTIDAIKDKVIMVHWYERGLRLFRIVQTAKHGSWSKAVEVWSKAGHPEYWQ